MKLKIRTISWYLKEQSQRTIYFVAKVKKKLLQWLGLDFMGFSGDDIDDDKYEFNLEEPMADS